MNINNPNLDLEYKTFDCDNFDFIFQFPDFKNWELKGIEKKENRCTMYFNWPDDILYEYPPRISIEEIESKNESKNEKSNLLKNPQGIFYGYVQDPGLYVSGHKFEEEDWDWLVFYGKDFSVRISKNSFGKLPFDADLFYKKIIETFDFK